LNRFFLDTENMSDDLISLNLDENIIRIAGAKNDNGKLDIELLVAQSGVPSFFESETKKVFDESLSSLKKIISLYRLSKKRFNIVIPDGFTYSQIVHMPRLKEKELLSAIKYQADQFIPMPIEETSLDLEILEDNKNSENILVLLVAAPQNLVERVQNIAEQSGIYPESIENELSATGKFLENFYSPQIQTGSTIFINIGYSYTSFYYFDHKKRLIIDNHTFPAGLSVFLREAQVDINVDSEKAKNLLKTVGFAPGSSLDLSQFLQPAIDALSSELQKFITALMAKHKASSPSHIYVYNLATDIKDIEKQIQKTVAIPIGIFNPLPITKRTHAVEPYVNNLPAFINVIGGCLK